jgi:hypothetical protein
MPVMWMGYVTVENLEASLATATELLRSMCRSHLHYNNR